MFEISTLCQRGLPTICQFRRHKVGPMRYSEILVRGNTLSIGWSKSRQTVLQEEAVEFSLSIRFLHYNIAVDPTPTSSQKY